MDRIEEILPRLFLTAAGIAIFNCLARPDFNLPLFIFALFIWGDNDKRERFKLLAILIVTFLVDFIWLCYWGGYKTEVGQGVHSFVVFMSVIGFLLKAAIIAAVCFVDKSAIVEALPPLVQDKVQGFVKFEDRA